MRLVPPMSHSMYAAPWGRDEGVDADMTTPDHVECARQHGHLLGFDVTPVKGSRRDQFNIVAVSGESGTMSAVIWCKDHVPTKTIVHRMHEVVGESGLNALQLYVQNYKQADLTLTGMVRKANLMANAAKTSGAPTQVGAGPRRASTAATAVATAAVNGSGPQARSEATEAASNAQQPGDKVCISCGIDVSPKWWPIDDSLERRLTNGHHGVIGSEAQKFVEQRMFQCHKCHKTCRTPKPYVPGPSPPADEPLHGHGQGSGQAVGGLPLRSPAATPSDYRPIRPEIHALLHHPVSHAPLAQPPPASPPAAAPPALSPVALLAASAPHVPSHVMGPRPVAGSHAYAAPRPASYSDWSHQAGPTHASPPRHVNGGAPPLLNGPSPPLANLSSLRPPAISGPPPVAPLLGGHHHAHSSSLYGNGMPPSPRLNGPPPPQNVSPGLSNGPASLSRPDAFSHGLHPQRAPYAGPHGSPPLSRSGQLPPPHEPTGPMGPRAPDGRLSSGASASPSLRNLLS